MVLGTFPHIWDGRATRAEWVIFLLSPLVVARARVTRDKYESKRGRDEESRITGGTIGFDSGANK